MACTPKKKPRPRSRHHHVIPKRDRPPFHYRSVQSDNIRTTSWVRWAPMKTSSLATDEEPNLLLPREGERHLRTGWPPHRRNQSSRSFQTPRQPSYAHLASQVNKSTAGDPHFFSVAFERAAQLLHDQQGKYPTVWAAVKSISAKLGCAPQDLYECANEYSLKNESPLQNINNT